MTMVTVTVNGIQEQYPKGTKYEVIADKHQAEYDGLIALAACNGKIRELFKVVEKDCDVSFFTLKDDVGHKTYVRTATMVLMKAVEMVAGEGSASKCKVECAIGRGYYVHGTNGFVVTPQMVEKIKEQMHRMVEKKAPIRKSAYPLSEAMELFKQKGMKDKEKLFRYRRSSYVNIYELDGYFDYYYGYMLPDAGYMPWFDLIPYDEGMMLLLPGKKEPTKVEPFAPRE